MTGPEFAQLFAKALDRLNLEITQYYSDQQMWETREGVPNSGGTLVLHLLGNLQHFIGAQLGKTGYVRQRELEFSRRDVPRAELLSELAEVHTRIQKILENLTSDDLTRVFPLESFGKGQTTSKVLGVLLAHLEYHLGQVNYHRRLLG